MGLCAATSVVVAAIRVWRLRLRLRLRLRRVERVVCLDVPRLALSCSGLLGSALLVKAACCTRCRRDEVQQNTVLLGWVCTWASTRLPSPLSATTAAHTFFPQRSKQRDRQHLPGRQVDSKVQERGEQEPRWSPCPTLHEGEARKALGSSPEQASRLKPSGGRFCPGLPGTSAPLPGRRQFVLGAFNACHSRTSRRPRVYSLKYQVGHSVLLTIWLVDTRKRDIGRAGQGKTLSEAYGLLQPSPLCVHSPVWMVHYMRLCVCMCVPLLSPGHGGHDLDRQTHCPPDYPVQMSIVN